MKLGVRIARPPVAVLVAGLVLTSAWAILRHQVATPQGLNRSVYDARGVSGELLATDTTATIDLDFLEGVDGLPPEFSVRWDGFWFVPREQRVTFQGQATALLRVYLDGELILRHDVSVSRQPARASVTLTSGVHQIVVDYDHEVGRREVSLQWAPSEAGFRPLPSSDFFLRRVDEQDYHETRAVGWLGWLAFGTWLTVALLTLVPVSLRRLAGLEAGTLSRRARTVAFPALLGPLQILLFGTHTIYTGNASEFSAPFWNIAAHWLPVLAGIVVSLIACGCLIPERWFRRYVVALFGVGLVTWLQGGVFLANYGAFTGEALDWELHAWRAPYEVALWLILPLGMVAMSRRLFEVAPFASQLFVALQVLLLIGSSFRGDAEGPTTFSDQADFVFELSRKQNVIHIVLDAFQSDIFHEILGRDPAVADALSGFTFFPDHAGAFRTTAASIPAMLTGEVYRNQEPIEPFFRGLMAERSLLSVLQERGFDTDAVSIHSRGIEAATNRYMIPKPYVSSDEYGRFAAWQLVDLSLFRHAPHVVKPWIYDDQNWRLQNWFGRTGSGAATRRRHHAENGRAFLEDFVRRVNVNRDRPLYKFLHVGIPHLPLVLDANCEFIGVNRSSRNGYLDQATCAATLVTRLLDRLRSLGVYDDSVIVLSSDHGANIPPSDFVDDRPLPFASLPRVVGNARALLVVKPAGATGPLRISQGPTTITDIPATVMDMLGIADRTFPGVSALTLDGDDRRDRRYAWYEWTDADWKRAYLRRMDVYSIHGHMSERASWAYVGSIFEPETALEEMSEGWDDSGTDESGRRLRLIGERVEFYAPRDAHAMVLEIRSTAPLPQTMTVTVFVNGNVVGRIHLDDHAWRSVEYAIPVSPGSRLARIDLLVDPAARLRPAAERERGVVARDVQWRR